MKEPERERFIYQLEHSLTCAVESRDTYTATHQNMVSRIAKILAHELKMSSHEVEGVRVAGQLHDIGKIAIPSSILTKTGKLHDEEFSLIKTHVQRGVEIIENIEFPWPIVTMVAQHHERLDWRGYPKGLLGSEIIVGSRILGVADTIDAVVHSRPYRKALGLETVISIFQDDDGSGYDIDVTEAFIRLVEIKDERLMQCL